MSLSRIEKQSDLLDIEIQKKWGLLYDEPHTHTSLSEIPSKDIDFGKLLEGLPFYIHESIQEKPQKKRIIFAEWYLSEYVQRPLFEKEIEVYTQLLKSGFECYVLTANGFIQVHSFSQLEKHFSMIVASPLEDIKKHLSDKGWYEHEIFILNADFLPCMDHQYSLPSFHLDKPKALNKDLITYLQGLSNPIISINAKMNSDLFKNLLPDLITLNLNALTKEEEVKLWISNYPKIKKLTIINRLRAADIFNEEPLFALDTLHIIEVDDLEESEESEDSVYEQLPYNALNEYDHQLIELLSHTPNISELFLNMEYLLTGVFIDEINLPKLKCLDLTCFPNMHDTHMENLLGRFPKLENLSLDMRASGNLFQKWPLNIALPHLKYLTINNGKTPDNNIIPFIFTCSRLKKIHLDNVFFNYKEINIEDRLDNLEKLVLEYIHFPFDHKNLLEKFFSRMVNLKKLTMQCLGNEIPLPRAQIQKLTSITINHLTICSSDLVTLFSNNMCLENLNLESCKIEGDLIFKMQYTALKKITLFNTLLNSNQVNALFSAFPNIEALYLSLHMRNTGNYFIPQVTNSKLKYISLNRYPLDKSLLSALLFNYPDLEGLDLLQCHFMCAPSLENKHSNLRRIKILDEVINTRQLLALIQSCSKLEKLHISSRDTNDITKLKAQYPSIHFQNDYLPSEYINQNKEGSDTDNDDCYKETGCITDQKVFIAEECINPDTGTIENPHKPITGRQLIVNLDVSSLRLQTYQYNLETDALNLIKPPQKLPELVLTPLVSESACQSGQLPLKNIQAGVWYPLPGISPYDEFHSVSVFNSDQRFVTDFCLGYYELNATSYIKFDYSSNGQSMDIHLELTTHTAPSISNLKKRTLDNPVENSAPFKKPCLSLEQHPADHPILVDHNSDNPHRANNQTALTDKEIQHSLLNPEYLKYTPLPIKLAGLIRFCKNFGSDAMQLQKNASNTEKMNQYILQQIGSCLHRSMVFARFCVQWGIPCRVIVNDVHAFIELFIDGLWKHLDLGGFKAALTINEIATPIPIVPFIRKKETFHSLDTCLAKLLNCTKPALVVVPESQIKTWITDIQAWAGRRMMLIKPENMRFHSIRLDAGNQKPTETESELALFLKSDELVYLILDFSDFKFSYIPLYTSLGDERKLAQQVLSKHIQPIILFPEHLSPRMRGDFWSRFSQTTFYATNYQAKTERPYIQQSTAILSKSDEYDLYGSNTFESLLTGTYEIDETGSLKPIPGALLLALQDKKPGIIINNPPQSKDFQSWLSALETRRTVFFNGEPHEVPPDFTIILNDTAYDLTHFDYSISNTSDLPINQLLFDLSNANFNTYFKNYRVNNSTGSLCIQESFFERYKNQSPCFWVTELLPVSQIFRLIKTASESNISLNFYGTESHLKPFLNATHTLTTRTIGSHNPNFITTNDATFWLLHNEALDQQTIPININTTYEELVYQITVKQKERFDFEFQLQTGILTDTLLSMKTSNIILVGSISASLTARLSTAWLVQYPYLWLNGEQIAVTGGLTVVVENHLDTLPFIPVTQNYTSADFYHALLLMYPLQENTAISIQNSITILEQHGISFSYRRLAVVFKAAQISPCKNPFKWVLQFEKNAHELIQCTNSYFFIKEPVDTSTLFHKIHSHFSATGSHTNRLLEAIIEEPDDAPYNDSVMQDLFEISERIPAYNPGIFAQFNNRLIQILQETINMPSPNISDINQKRIKKLENAFAIHPVVFLLGSTGTGKSHFMENALQTLYEVFILDKEQPGKTIIEWLTSKSTKPKMLISDEVNLIPQNILVQLANRQNNTMLVNGTLYELADHYMLLAGNPSHYRNRQHCHFFDEICTIEFKPLSEQDLYTLIVKPILKNETIVNTFWDKCKPIHTKTPRDIAQKAHRHLIKQGGQHDTVAMLDLFSTQNPTLYITKGWEKLLGKLQLDIQERLYKMEHKTTVGKFGILIEGVSALGKTTFITALLRMNQIDYVDLTGKNVSEMKRLLNLAFHAGSVVLIDEINTIAPLFEWELNHYMEGKDPAKNPATNPGFFVIGTLNPPREFSDRIPLSPALENRFEKRFIEPYTVENLQYILQIKGKSEIEAEKLAQRFSEGQKLNPPLTFYRDMGM